MIFALSTIRECVQMTVAVNALLRIAEERAGHNPDGCDCDIGRALRLYEGAVEYLQQAKHQDDDQRLPEEKERSQ